MELLVLGNIGIVMLLAEVKNKSPVSARLFINRLNRLILETITDEECYEYYVRQVKLRFRADVFARKATLPYDVWKQKVSSLLDSMIYEDEYGHVGLEYSHTSPIRPEQYPSDMWEIKLRNLDLSDFAERYGWILLVNTIQERNHYNPKRISLVFQPYFTPRVFKIPDRLYHVTKTSYVRNILRRGILPKRGERKETFDARTYPGRVYLTTSRQLAQRLETAFMKSKIQKNYDATVESDYTLLVIDTKKLQRGTKFFIDPEGAGVDMFVWTNSRIPPEAISIDSAYIDKYEEFTNDIRTKFA